MATRRWWPWVWAASIPLWFLAAYLSLVFLAPLLYGFHRRYGLAFPAVIAIVVLALDVARMQFDVGYVGDANYLFVWLVFHQVGFAWQDGRLALRPGVAGAFAALGVGALVWMTAAGPYPVSMVGVPGQDLQNTSPPSFALLILGLTQAAFALLLNGPMNRSLQRTGAWTVVVAINAVILTMFLWHMSAGVLAAVALYPTGLLPQPEVDSGEWLLWRIPWVAACAVVLAVLVSVFSRIEARSAGMSKGQAIGDPPALGAVRLPRAAWQAVVVVGVACVVLGLLTIAMVDPTPEFVAGLPTAGLLSYLAGAALLRWTRHQHSPSRDHQR